MTLKRLTGLVLFALPVAFNLLFFALGSAFEYPQILRQPTDHILRQFVAGGSNLVVIWYLFAATSLLMIPVALLFQRSFASRHPQLAQASALIGVVSGLVQAIGLFRWTFVVPTLAAQYVDPASSAATRDADAVVFQALHQFAGVEIGEHLGYLLTGTWTIVIAAMMFRTAPFRPLLGVIGLVAAVGIMAGLLEPAGWQPAGAINAMSYILWSLWLMASGVIVFFARTSD